MYFIFNYFTMSRKFTLKAVTGVTYKGEFYPANSTFEVSEEMYKELQETRFFRHNILINVTKKDEKVKED